MQFVFVYGSLKRGHKLHNLLAEQRCLGTAVTQPRYRMFDCGRYPGLCDAERGRSIHGELYCVDEQTLAALDLAEGVDEELYERRSIQLQVPHDSIPVQAWFYLRDTSRMPDCGDRWPRVS